MTKKDLQRKLEEAEKTLEEMRLQIKYLEYDVEATRRERDYFKGLSTGK